MGFFYGENQNMKRAFTLLELLVVVIIVGIFVAMAIPNMSSTVEKGRGKNAEFSLMAIYNAQKRYRLRNPSGVFYESNVINEINENLSLNIEDAFFVYAIAKNGKDGYKATATRGIDGMCKGQIMYITNEGGKVEKGCRAW
jgi:prepilin-type N-terminal cleavage/methylation domain-containing protein